MITTTIKGQTMIFKNQQGFYSTSISKKNKNNQWDSTYINVGFRKETNLENKTMIDIKDGWLTFDKYTKQDGSTNVYFKIFVNDYDIVSSQMQESTNAQPVMANSEFDVNDLPF
jgi:hypothetical protein